MERDETLWRQQSERERELIETILLADFPGRDEIAVQLRAARVQSDCECGCGSFAVQRRAGTPAAPANGASLNAHGEDDDGTLVGLFIMVQEGYVDYVECYGLPRSAVSLPVPNSLRLTTDVRISDGHSQPIPDAETILERHLRLRG